ncbi:MAG: aminotransferase class I/II-fold pyridoxal phosphate-dependent enzyme [Terracidiphilus sp.]
MPNDFIPRHGGQLRELAAEFGIPETSLIDFSASVNPLPPPDAVVNVLCDQMRTRTILTAYPDINYTALKQALAEYAQVDPSAIAIGNGVMPLLDAALRGLGLRKCLVPVPSFTEYRRVLRACGTECCVLKYGDEEEFAIDAGSVISELKATNARAVLVANPQSPSGRLVNGTELLQLCEAAFALGVTTIVDEAFIDYAPEESLSRTAAKLRGLVVLRTLTKFFAMPGLRVAYAVAHPEVRAAMESCIPAWPVDSIAAEAARLALADGASMAAARDTNKRERSWLADNIRSLGVEVFSSEANFLLVRIAKAREGYELWQRLIIEHCVVIRSCANFEGMDERYFRIGVRTNPENRMLVRALAEELHSKSQ